MELGVGPAHGELEPSDAVPRVSVLPFTAVLALLGGLARRAGGQSMMSRQRKWRVAIGIVLLLILVAIAVTGATASDSSERGGGGRSSNTTR